MAAPAGEPSPWAALSLGAMEDVQSYLRQPHDRIRIRVVNAMLRRCADRLRDPLRASPSDA
jgi:hypothetical protein